HVSRGAAGVMVARGSRGVLHVHRLLAVRVVSADTARRTAAGLEVSVSGVAPGTLRPSGPRAIRRAADSARAAQSDVMKVIALVPVRNESWILEHSLACWSAFCDVIIVSDQESTDGSRDIYRR